MPGCEDRAVHFHHVVERQELKRRKGDASDARNGVFLCFRCHGDVTSASRRLTLAALPDSVFEFAWELMGPAATVYLRRYHDGEDERLDRLVELADS